LVQNSKSNKICFVRLIRLGIKVTNIFDKLAYLCDFFMINYKFISFFAMQDYQILLFYKYIDIEDPHQFAIQQRAWCDDLNLTGRTLVSYEGINSTLEGSKENTEKYIQRMKNKNGFEDIHWKKSVGDGQSFPKLSIKVRNEVVAIGVEEKDQLGPHRNLTGKYISPEELNSWINSDKKFYIIDMRNDYEHQIGHFKNSILPKELKNFRDLPKILPSINHLKNETVVTVCTGGIRCEKASGFLIKHGFSDVYQLNGGIVSYMEKYPNLDFLGKLYVFDNRLMIGYNTDSKEHIIVGKCQLCSSESENIINYYLPNQKCRNNGIICKKCVGEKRVIVG
jgi:UPF0176 protein